MIGGVYPHPLLATAHRMMDFPLTENLVRRSKSRRGLKTEVTLASLCQLLTKEPYGTDIAGRLLSCKGAVIVLSNYCANGLGCSIIYYDSGKFYCIRAILFKHREAKDNTSS